MNEEDDQRNAPKDPDRLLAEITTAMKNAAGRRTAPFCSARLKWRRKKERPAGPMTALELWVRAVEALRSPSQLPLSMARGASRHRRP